MQKLYLQKWYLKYL